MSVSTVDPPRIAGPSFSAAVRPPDRDALVHELRARGLLRQRSGDAWLVSATSAPASPQFARVTDRQLLEWAADLISGTDDRVDAEDAPTGPPQRARTSVAAVLDRSKMVTHADGSVSWTAASFFPVLCADMKFSTQPVMPAMRGTAFIAGSNTTIVTAGHVLTAGNYTNLCCVFGPWTYNPADSRVYFKRSQVYPVKQIVKRSFKIDWSEPDYCVAKLDRGVTTAYIPPVDDSPLAVGAPLYTLGHPHGLSLKYAANAAVHNVASAHWYGTNLDVLPICSGSPVFHATSHAIVGVVSHSPPQTEWYPTAAGCNKLVTCSPCNESCTRISHLSGLLA